MELLVFSDSHGDYGALAETIEKNPEIASVVHCGDGWKEGEKLEKSYPEKTFYRVAGNCDWGTEGREHDEFIINREKIVVTHGHLYGVKSNLHQLGIYAKQEGAKICFYGHTHKAKVEELSGVWFINPGFASRKLGGSPSYALVSIVNGQPLVKFIPL